VASEFIGRPRVDYASRSPRADHRAACTYNPDGVSALITVTIQVYNGILI